MTQIASMYADLIRGYGIEDLDIPVGYVKLFARDDTIPDAVRSWAPREETLTVCQALRYALLAQPVLLDLNNIGCIAAAISLGLVDARQKETLASPPRAYLQQMARQSGLGPAFEPPAPEDFTNGTVYACRDAGRPEFGLFGPEDSGRFDCVATARRAIAAMDVIQPATMQGAFFYDHTFEGLDLLPDVVLLSVRPVELTKLLQSYQYVTGRPIQAHMNPLRAVDADLIARPYLTGEINISCYCLGARTLARFEGDRMGVGMPLAAFERLLEGMAASATGYPYTSYQDA
jgi:uncharacterized protein (DUF169 family)